MNKTQQHRLTLKFIEAMGLETDHHTATLVDLIVNHKESSNPVDDLVKASFYLLRMIEKLKDDQSDVETDPGIKPKTKILRVYDRI